MRGLTEEMKGEEGKERREMQRWVRERRNGEKEEEKIAKRGRGERKMEGHPWVWMKRNKEVREKRGMKWMGRIINKCL